MIHEPVISDEKHPPEMSESPYNAYYLRSCGNVQRSPAYASCLFKVNEAAAGRKVDWAPDCMNAIERKCCDAVGMQEQERLQGVAMFYVQSASYKNKQLTNLTPENERPAARPGFAVEAPYVSNDPRAANYKGRHQEFTLKRSSTSSAPSTPTAPKPTHFLDMEAGGYADAINAAMAATAQPEPAEVKPIQPAPAPAVRPVEQPKTPAAPVKAGMSLLEMARQQMAAKANQS